MNAVDMSKDKDLLYTRWFEKQADVMTVLAGMQRSGWTVTRDGLMTEGDKGPIVCRTLKIKGQDTYTGLGFWRVSPCNFDQ